MMEPDWTSDDGSVKLYCGDCLDVLPHLGGVDAVVTDPPWNCGYFGKSDNVDWKIYSDMLAKWKSAADICEGQCWFLSTKSITNVANQFQGWKPFASVKNFSQMTRKSLPNCWDIAWIRYGANEYRANGRNWCVANTAGMLREKTGHPTPRTINVMQYVIELFTWPVVLDPFMGSGTTGVACVRTNRKFIGIEIDKGYFEIAKRRIEKAIAEKSELLVYA